MMRTYIITIVITRKTWIELQPAKVVSHLSGDWERQRSTNLPMSTSSVNPDSPDNALISGVRTAIHLFVVAFCNKRGTCEQLIKEGKGAIRWTRLSGRSFAANAVRLQLHTLAYNIGNFLRTPATPEPIKDWSLTSLKEELIKIGAKVVSHGRYVAFQMARSPFQMAQVAIPRKLFADIPRLIAELRPPPPLLSTA